MGSKSLQRSAWLTLVAALVVIATMSSSASAGSNDASALKPYSGSTVMLRLRGAIDALFEPLSSSRAPNRVRLPSEGDYIDLGPLD